MTLVRLSYLLAALCCLVAQTVSANQYDVEVIVFRNLAGRDDGEQSSAVTTGGGFARSPLQQGLENLPDSQFALNDVANALRRSGAYQVLAHRLWRQGGHDQREAVPYLLHDDVPGGSNVLDGSITLVRERYLYLVVNLNLGTPGSSYRLNESRKVRYGELHYFDSPRLGVIARVTPYGVNEPEPENSAGGGDTSAVPDKEIDTGSEPPAETPPD
jgi:hypothetical protein